MTWKFWNGKKELQKQIHELRCEFENFVELEATKTNLNKLQLSSHNLPKQLPERFNDSFRDRALLEQQNCPACGKPSLKAAIVLSGPDGWEAHWNCTQCLAKGNMNSFGYQIDLAPPLTVEERKQ